MGSQPTLGAGPTFKVGGKMLETSVTAVRRGGGSIPTSKKNWKKGRECEERNA